MERYLSDPSSMRRRETCKILFNLISVYPESLEKLNEVDVISRLAWILVEDSTDTRVEAMRCILTAVSICSEEDLPLILSAEIFSAVLKNIESNNSEIAICSLDTLFQILHNSERYCENLPNPVLDKFKELNGINILEQISTHKCDQISSRCIKILDTFLGGTNN